MSMSENGGSMFVLGSILYLDNFEFRSSRVILLFLVRVDFSSANFDSSQSQIQFELVQV